MDDIDDAELLRSNSVPRPIAPPLGAPIVQRAKSAKGPLGGADTQPMEPRGKRVLRRGVSSHHGSRRQLSRHASAHARMLAPKLPAPLGDASERWARFTPATVLLSAEGREMARETVRAGLREHFMFNGLSSAQLDDAIGAMRHRLVRQGHTVTVAGEKATQFFVCTQGGLHMTMVAPGAAQSVLVAQVGPSGSFGSASLLGDDATVKVTTTAVVDSEVFALSRDAFQRIQRSRPRAAAPCVRQVPLPSDTIAMTRDALQKLGTRPST